MNPDTTENRISYNNKKSVCGRTTHTDTDIGRHRHRQTQTYTDADIHRYRHTQTQTYTDTDIHRYRHTQIQIFIHVCIKIWHTVCVCGCVCVCVCVSCIQYGNSFVGVYGSIIDNLTNPAALHTGANKR